MTRPSGGKPPRIGRQTELLDLGTDRPLPGEAPAPTMLATTDPVPPPGPEVRVGLVLQGRYRLDQELAAGGMGRVFRAEHLGLKVPVAVKVLHGFMSSSEDATRRFFREARAASLINHENVVKVFDFGTHDGKPFLVMELVQGESLADFLDGLAAPPALHVVKDAMEQLLRSLVAAHAAGVVHRDLKPANVMVGRDGTGQWLLKMADFGLAHLDDPRDFGGTLTRTDSVAGTPDYMSPEQCRSLRVGASTDLYAMGCIVTELLQLRPPFSGASAVDVISKHMFTPPPPLERPADAEPVPQLLERLRLALLAKVPHERPADAVATLKSLQEAFDLGANERQFPDRKERTVAGPREERAPKWVGTKSQSAPERELSVALVVRHGGESSLGAEIETALFAAGFGVHRAGDSSSADLVLLDVGPHTEQMFEWLIEETKARPSAKVLVVAERLGASDVHRLVEAGAADAVRAPAKLEQLLRKLERLRRDAGRGP